MAWPEDEWKSPLLPSLDVNEALRKSLESRRSVYEVLDSMHYEGLGRAQQMRDWMDRAWEVNMQPWRK